MANINRWYILPENLFFVLTLSTDQKRHSWYYVLRPDERDLLACLREFNAREPRSRHKASMTPALKPLTSYGSLTGSLGEVDFVLLQRSFER